MEYWSTLFWSTMPLDTCNKNQGDAWSYLACKSKDDKQDSLYKRRCLKVWLLNSDNEAVFDFGLLFMH